MSEMFLITVFFLIISFIKVSKIKRYDKIVYSLYDSRIQIMNYLRKNFETISKEDYEICRVELERIEDTLTKEMK